MRPRIVAAEPLRREFLQRLAQIGDVVYEPDAWQSPNRLELLTGGAQVLVTRSFTHLTATVLENAPALSCVAVYGAGHEHLDLNILAARNITVLRCSEAIASTMAEYTLGLALALSRRIVEAVDHCRAGGWNHHALVGRSLSGRRALVVGCGPIGQATALLLRRIEMEVALCRRSGRALPRELLDSNVSAMALEDGLGWADLITLHVSGGLGSRNLIGTAEVAKMRPGTWLINTSRGSVVDVSAVLEGLKRGSLAGAALDVWPTEPPVAPVPEHPRLIITPHLALYAEEAIEARIADLTAQIAAWWVARRYA